MKSLLKIFKKYSGDRDIIIVSGLPRSGTSLMMKMLEAGGLIPFIAVLKHGVSTWYIEALSLKHSPDRD